MTFLERNRYPLSWAESPPWFLAPFNQQVPYRLGWVLSSTPWSYIVVTISESFNRSSMIDRCLELSQESHRIHCVPSHPTFSLRYESFSILFPIICLLFLCIYFIYQLTYLLFLHLYSFCIFIFLVFTTKSLWLSLCVRPCVINSYYFWLLNSLLIFTFCSFFTFLLLLLVHFITISPFTLYYMKHIV